MAGDVWEVGDWTFAYSDDDEYWYPAEIVDINDNQVKVRFDIDDSEEWLDVDDLADYEADPAEEGVECWWKKDDEYYAVSILEVKGEDVLVEFEDGEQAWVDLSHLRYEG